MFSLVSRTLLSMMTVHDQSEARISPTITDFTTQSARMNRLMKLKVSAVIGAASMLSRCSVSYEAHEFKRRAVANLRPPSLVNRLLTRKW